MAANWDNLKSKIGAEAFDSIRHDCGRKLDSFRDARETVKIGREVYEQLEKVELANEIRSTICLTTAPTASSSLLWTARNTW